MTDLRTRVREALGTINAPDCSEWEWIMRLFEADPDAFYRLASSDLTATEDVDIDAVGRLARTLRTAVRNSYRLIAPVKGQGYLEAGDMTVAIPGKVFGQVTQFLLRIDGKATSAAKGKDYEGRQISEAEVMFKLGDTGEYHDLNDLAGDELRPLVFRVDQGDLQSLKHQPAYVVHNLQRCARAVIHAPTAVYRDLRRGERAAPQLRQGWAICGRPTRAYGNDGLPVQAPDNKVFMVYADQDRCVFDWDWVQEDHHDPGHPLDAALRFGNPVPLLSDLALDLPAQIDHELFDPCVATLSDKGDCVFCYICDEVGYAERINPDLTVFREFATNEVTGFKVKNFRRILLEEKFFVSNDAPDLRVKVGAIFLATLKANQDASANLYFFIIQALLKRMPQLPELQVRRPELQSAGCAGK